MVTVLKVSGFYLVCVRYIDGLTAFGHVTHNARTPRYVYFFFLFHFLERGPGAHVEQFGHQAFRLAALKMVRRGRGRHYFWRHRTDVGGTDWRTDDQAADSRRRFFDRGRPDLRRLRRGRRVIRNTVVAAAAARRLQTVAVRVLVGRVVHVVMVMMVIVVVMVVVRVVVVVAVKRRRCGVVFAGRDRGHGHGRGGDDGGGGCDRGRGGVVVFAQAPDGYAGVRPPGAAQALRDGPVVIVLARRQTATLDQEQRAPVGVQQRADVLQDLVAQRPDVQFVAYVLYL